MSRWYGWDFPRVHGFGQFFDIIPAQVCCLPNAGEDLIPRERADLFFEVKALLCKSDAIGGNGNGIPDSLGFCEYPALDQLFCMGFTRNRISQ